VVVMPDTDVDRAAMVGKRLRRCIATAPIFTGDATGYIDVTASVGAAALEFADDAHAIILKRADQALYCAKREGHNRVGADAA
jgi:two-component system cell cycle response regulator